MMQILGKNLQNIIKMKTKYLIINKLSILIINCSSRNSNSSISFSRKLVKYKCKLSMIKIFKIKKQNKQGTKSNLKNKYRKIRYKNNKN